MKYISLISFFFISFAWAQNGTRSQLEHWLLDYIPPENFPFWTLRPHVTEEINNSPVLTSLANTGEAFFKFYHNRMVQDFGENARFFQNVPEVLLADWVRTMEVAMTRERSSVMPEREARGLAWQDTLARFPIPSTIESEIDLEAKRLLEPELGEAFEFYHSQFLKYQTIERSERAPGTQDIELIRSQLLARLRRLRQINFQTATSRVSRLNPGTIYLESSAGRIPLGPREFANMSVELRPLSSAKATHRVQEKPYWLSVWLNGVASRRDFNAAEFSYVREWHPPRVADHSVILTVGKSTYVLAETEFSRLLHLLYPPIEEIRGGEQAWEKRYLLESVNRDSLIADVATWVQGIKIKNVADLKRQIHSRIRGHSNPPGYGLTQITLETRDRPLSEVLKIEWYGYSLHPNYWTIRGNVANYLNIFEKRFKLSRWRVEKKVFLREAWRRAGTQTRNLIVAGTLLALATLGPPAAWKANQWLDHGGVGRTAGVVLNKGVNPTTIIEKLGEGWDWSKEATESLNNMLSGLKYSIPGTGYVVDLAKLGATGNFGDENGAEAQTKVFRVSVASGVSPPAYFNWPDREELTIGPWPSYDFRPANVAEESAAPIVVETEAPHKVFENIVPVITPSGYDVISMRVKRDGKILARDKYTLYRNSYGLYYLAIDKSESSRWSEYSYRAGYDSRHSNVSLRSEPVDTEALRSVITELKTRGALELAEKLEPLAGGSANVGDLETAVWSTGYYTKKSGGPIYFTHEPLNFERDTNYLRDGIFYVQCTRGNVILIKLVKRTSRLNARPIFGFLYDGSGFVVAENAHMHTLLIDRERAEEIDGTPDRLEPGAKRDAPLPRGGPVESPRRDGRAQPKEDGHSNNGNGQPKQSEARAPETRSSESRQPPAAPFQEHNGNEDNNFTFVDLNPPIPKPRRNFDDEFKRKEEGEEIIGPPEQNSTEDAKSSVSDSNGSNPTSAQTRQRRPPSRKKPKGKDPRLHTREIFELENARLSTDAAINKIANAFRPLQNPATRPSAPGMLVFPLARIVLDYAKGARPSLTLRQLIALNQGYRVDIKLTPEQQTRITETYQRITTSGVDPAVRRLCREISDRVSGQILDEEVKEHAGTPSPNQYLVISEVREKLEGLMRILTNTSWAPPPNFKYDRPAPPSSKASCQGPFGG